MTALNPKEFDTRILRTRILKFLQHSFDDFYEHTIAADKKGVLTWMSESYCQFLGLTESPVGKHITEIIPNSYLPQVIASGKPVLLDVLYIRNQWVLVSAVPLLNKHKEVEGAFAFVATDNPSTAKPLLAKYNRLQSEVRNSKHYQSERSSRYQLSQISGQSEALKTVKHQIRQAGRFDISVLLTGETGTGKELFAHALHNLSDRADKPFVSINVAAIPDTLIESEFFGVAPGAFTGAKKEGRPGKIEIAQDGTLFLDEIGDMPLALQSKLLRVLQEKEFEKIGSNEVQATNVRIVAATSRDLLQMVSIGEFRADLYYRLSAMPIHLPPLRERMDDIELLSERILDECCERLGVPTKELTTDALDILRSHDWPGNVRELYNVIERACIMNENATQISAKGFRDVFSNNLIRHDELRPSPATQTTPQQPPWQTLSNAPKTLKEQVRETERQVIIEALKQAGGQRTRAAKALGISRAALYQKLEALQIN
ncbi:transcriptional regulator [Nitrincola sp. A-D6]|uniref:sigma-54 interaction domain-containing protein n=1 Tax=Nitrincola sp. A-D6 TaxID=1545442 RepID=UPI00051FA2E9|nr:sigma 54-interacting transcriptional regulator [Nitrincola sp. A-D6]KGK42071.1 transcriptional regulator [Nitrincola sp. A-D6]